jgi:MFS family permease
MARERVFYGWWVTIAFGVMVLLSTGVRFSVGPFLKPIVADLGTDRAAYSLIVSLSLFLYGVFMPFVGGLVERWGARPVTVLGTLVFAVSLITTSLVTHLWQLALTYGVLVALGLSATGHVVGSAVVSRWFTRRRATALSVLGAASMAGMSLLVPAAMWLILRFGWRAAYAIIGMGATVVLPAPRPVGRPGFAGGDRARPRRRRGHADTA